MDGIRIRIRISIRESIMVGVTGRVGIHVRVGSWNRLGYSRVRIRVRIRFKVAIGAMRGVRVGFIGSPRIMGPQQEKKMGLGPCTRPG